MLAFCPIVVYNSDKEKSKINFDISDEKDLIVIEIKKGFVDSVYSDNPNIDIINRAELEVANIADQESNENQTSNEVSPSGFDYSNILNMSQDQINEAINRANGVRTPRESRFGLLNRIRNLSNRMAEPVTRVINPISETADNLVDFLLFGSDNYDEDGRLNLREELMNIINPVREGVTGAVDSVRNRISRTQNQESRVEGTDLFGESYEYLSLLHGLL